MTDPAHPAGSDPVTVLEAQTWAFAAAIATMRDAATTSLDHALSADPARTAVLEAAGLVTATGAGFEADPVLRRGPSVAGVRLNALRLALAAATGTGSTGWGEQPDEVLLDQGRASAMTGHALATRVAPELPGLAARLARPGSRVLDVGTGVGALALALARDLPDVHVTGIDVLDRAIRLARRELDDAGLEARRVEVRLQDVAELDDRGVYDLVWLPVPFLSEDGLRAALPRVAAAVAEGGWLVAGTNPPVTDPLAAAVARWAAVRGGGNATDADRMSALLRDAGWRDVRSIPTVPGGPVLVAAQRGAGVSP